MDLVHLEYGLDCTLVHLEVVVCKVAARSMALAHRVGRGRGKTSSDGDRVYLNKLF